MERTFAIIKPDAFAAGDAGAAAMRDKEDAGETPAAAPEEADAQAELPDDAEVIASTPDGDGIDALTAAEIGLAVALGVLVAGSLVLAFAGRKR